MRRMPARREEPKAMPASRLNAADAVFAIQAKATGSACAQPQLVRTVQEPLAGKIEFLTGEAPRWRRLSCLTLDTQAIVEMRAANSGLPGKRNFR